jgi:hypothetical protein
MKLLVPISGGYATVYPAGVDLKYPESLDKQASDSVLHLVGKVASTGCDNNDLQSSDDKDGFNCFIASCGCVLQVKAVVFNIFRGAHGIGTLAQNGSD